MRYLQAKWDLHLILETDKNGKASFGTNHDMKSQNRWANVIWNRCFVHNIEKTKDHPSSLTEAVLVGINKVLSQSLRTQYLLNHKAIQHILLSDTSNMSTIFWARMAKHQATKSPGILDYINCFNTWYVIVHSVVM